MVKNLQADVPNGDPGLAPKEENTVLQKLQKWADYDSYGEPVPPTRYDSRAAGSLSWPTTAVSTVGCLVTRRTLMCPLRMIQRVLTMQVHPHEDPHELRDCEQLVARRAAQARAHSS